MLKRTLLFGCAVLLAAAPRLSAQERGAAALGELIDGLGTTTRVLMIGAHPDDEDTQLIAYLAKARHIETAYLSLTRGDGGQNLIGNELGPVARHDPHGGAARGAPYRRRTSVLHARVRFRILENASTRRTSTGRRIRFSRTWWRSCARSGRRSSSPSGRARRPDGHGHHQYAGVLAREVFDAAADSVRFPPVRRRRAPAVDDGEVLSRAAQRAGASLTFNVGEYDRAARRDATRRSRRRAARSIARRGRARCRSAGRALRGVKLEVSRVSDANGAENAACSTGSIRRGRGSRSFGLPTRCARAVDSLPAARAAGRRRSISTIRRRWWSRSSRTCASRRARRAACACATLDARMHRRPRVHAARWAISRSRLASTPSARRRSVARRRRRDGRGDGAARAHRAARHGAGHGVGVQPGQDADRARARVARSTQLGMASQHGATILARQRRATDADVSRAGPIRRCRGGSGARRMATRSRSRSRRWSPAKIGCFELGRRGRSCASTACRSPFAPGRSSIGTPTRCSARSAVRSRRCRRSRCLLAARRRVRARELAVRSHDASSFVHSARRHAARRRRLARAAEGTHGRHGDASRDAQAVRRRESVLPRAAGSWRPAATRSSRRATSHGESFTLGFVPIEYEHIRPQRIYRQSTVQIEAVNATFANLQDRLHPRRRRQRDADARAARSFRSSSSIR